MIKKQLLVKRFIALLVFLILSLNTSCINDLVHEKTVSYEESDMEEKLLVTDIDGNTYETFKVGDQVWMAENLRVTHYNDGTPIEYYKYENDSSLADVYGLLYDWSAVKSGETGDEIQGLAPEGWHIPSKAEWEELAEHLGGIDVAGGKMKGLKLWNVHNSGTIKESGFNAIPGGMYDFTGTFQWLGETACFASTTSENRGVSYVYINSKSDKLNSGNFRPDDAVSVRCVKDK